MFYIESLIKTGSIPENSLGTYFSFDKIDEVSKASKLLQVPHDAAIRIEFDTLQVIDDIRIPYGKWGKANYFEPLTKDFPKFGYGGATQAVTHESIQVKRIIDLRTGEVLYEAR